MRHFENMFWFSGCTGRLPDFMNYENIFLCSGCKGRLPDSARAEVRECEGRTVQERPKTGDEIQENISNILNCGNHKILTKVISY